MPIKGQVVQWDAGKGYGFIQPEDGSARIFVQARAFGLRAHKPYVGERVSFEPALDGQGKRRAVDVRSLNPRRPSAAPAAEAPPCQAPKHSRRGLQLWLIPAFALLVLACALVWPLPNALWGFYMAMSLASFLVYAGDKRAARLGGWRVREATLHGLALACGWPGALLAQHLLRHKSAKPGFQRLFWLTVAGNILLFTLLFTPLGTRLLRALMQLIGWHD